MFCMSFLITILSVLRVQYKFILIKLFLYFLQGEQRMFSFVEVQVM